jgi:hypothetical protein
LALSVLFLGNNILRSVWKFIKCQHSQP